MPPAAVCVPVRLPTVVGFSLAALGPNDSTQSASSSVRWLIIYGRAANPSAGDHFSSSMNHYAFPSRGLMGQTRYSATSFFFFIFAMFCTIVGVVDSIKIHFKYTYTHTEHCNCAALCAGISDVRSPRPKTKALRSSSLADPRLQLHSGFKLPICLLLRMLFM